MQSLGVQREEIEAAIGARVEDFTPEETGIIREAAKIMRNKQIDFQAAVAEVTVSPYLPAPRRFTRVETIGVGEIPNGPASRGAAAPLLRSLNGSWKISGLESSTRVNMY